MVFTDRYISRAISSVLSSASVRQASSLLRSPATPGGASAAVQGARDHQLNVTIPPGQRVRARPEGDRYLGFSFAETDMYGAVEQALSAARQRLRVMID